MRYYFAPMEGVTGYIYRRAHQRCFPGAGRYYMPFLSPRQDHAWTRREWQEIVPENNTGVQTVPQLLTRHGTDFLWAAGMLAELGYEEVNLNLGCPSGTVTAKGKGSGLLGRFDELERLLDEIFAHAPLAISVKTRLGIREEEEFWPILELFNRYPIAELTIHPRVQKDLYRNQVRMDTFAAALTRSRNPVCYNGDLTTADDVADFTGKFPAAEAVMLGRGAVADPALFRRLNGGGAVERAELKAFHDLLYQDYCSAFGSAHSAMMRMKELWFYMAGLFEGGERMFKNLRKEKFPAGYETAVEEIFASIPLRRDARPVWRN